MRRAFHKCTGPAVGCILTLTTQQCDTFGVLFLQLKCSVLQETRWCKESRPPVMSHLDMFLIIVTRLTRSEKSCIYFHHHHQKIYHLCVKSSND